jgi:hypothetical protein
MHFAAARNMVITRNKQKNLTKEENLELKDVEIDLSNIFHLQSSY